MQDPVISRDMAQLPPSLQPQLDDKEKPAATFTEGGSKVNGTIGTNGGLVANGDGERVTATETLEDLEEKRAAGAAIYDFDPDATPEQKKAQALKGAKDKLAPLSDRLAARHEGGSEVATDIGGHSVAPSISIKDVAAASAAETSKALPDTQAAGEVAVPGGLPQQVAAAIPDWYKVGWRAQNRDFLESGGDLEEMRQRSLLDEFLNESYYGAWYHNAAIIFFAVFASHFVTVFGGGWGSLMIILAFCSTYYNTSIRRVRQRARDDLNRQLSKQRLFTDSESVDWMNNFLSRFWLIYEPVLAATIVASVDQTLSYSAPPGIDSMRMTHFTLGTKAPRVDFIRTHPKTENDVVVMDWKISFTPNDTADLTARQAADKVNPKVVLTIKFGKGKIVLAKDIVVEDVAFAGVMRMRLKLMHNFPHVQTVDISFLEKPMIDYAAKPIGFDLNMIPGLEGFIDNQIHATLGPMMYDPNVFTINLEQLLSSAPIDTAVGVLQITVYNARGLKGVKIGGGVPDPYVSFDIGSRTGLAKTKTKHSSANPHWNESKFLLVNSLNDSLIMNVMDFNDHRKDSELGAASFDLRSLNDDAEQEDLTAPVILGGKPRGVLKFDARFFPVLTPKKLADGSEEPLPESNTGVVRLTLHQAKDLDFRKTGSDCNPYARIYLKGQQIYKTPTFKRNHSPMWEAHTEFLVTQRKDAVIGVKVIDNKGFAVDPTIGYVNVKLEDILTANANKQDWFPLSGCATGKLRISAVFKPVAMAGAINSANDFRPPIGVVRIWIKRANDLKNVEALTGGKSDPYVRVIRHGLIVARTLVFDNNLDPEFDEIIYAPVHNLNETLILETMDYQHNSKDRSLGVTQIDMKTLAAEGSDKTTPFVSNGPVSRSDPLRTDNGKAYKGTLIYEAKFVPAIPLRGVAFDKVESPLTKVTPKAEDQDDDGASVIETDAETATMEGDDEVSQQMRADMLQQTNGAAVNGAVRSSSRASNHTKNALSTATAASVATAGTTESVTEGVSMTREELFNCQSGILVFNIVSGQLASKGARLEVLFDDGYWPSYSTEVARTTHQTWDEVGEAFIRELGYSRIILKLNQADKESREDVQAIFRTSLKEFLEECLDKPATFTLYNENGGNRSQVTISAKYVPVPIQLEMRETVNNTGILRVDLLDGSGLKSADRNGKSDPYCHFTLNGARVHKSSVQKKTLNPKWNENFEVAVPSRVAARFTVEVFDWDRVGTADKLGSGEIDVVNIEPFQATPQTIKLSDRSGQEHGVINVRLVFRPEFVARTRAATSTFVGGLAGGAAAGVGGVVGGGAHLVGKGGRVALGGAGAVAGGVGAVGKGVFSGVRSVVPLGHGHRRATSSSLAATADGIPEGEEGYAVAESMGAGLQPIQSVSSGVNGRMSFSPAFGSPDFGDLQVTLKEVDSTSSEGDKTYVLVKHGTKTVDKSHSIKGTSGVHDVFHVKTLPESCVLSFFLMAKKSLGRDKELGQAEFDVWQHIQPGTRNAADAQVAIGSTTVSLSLAWTPAGNASATPPLPSSKSMPAVSQQNQSLNPDSPASIKSRSRFSLHRNR